MWPQKPAERGFALIRKDLRLSNMQPNWNPRAADCLNHGTSSIVTTEHGTVQADTKANTWNSLIYVSQAPELLGTAFESQLQLAEEIGFSLQGSDDCVWLTDMILFLDMVHCPIC
jgi:hypothetical protein